MPLLPQPGKTRADFVKSPALWLCLAGLALIADWWSGPYADLEIVHVVLVALATWFSGRRVGRLLAVVFPGAILVLSLDLWVVPWPDAIALLNTGMRILVLLFFVYLIDTVAEQRAALEQEVRTLRGILPICSFCKSIRSDGRWEPLEKYIHEHSEADFTHSVCPECAIKHYGIELPQDPKRHGT